MYMTEHFFDSPREHTTDYNPQPINNIELGEGRDEGELTIYMSHDSNDSSTYFHFDKEATKRIWEVLKNKFGG